MTEINWSKISDAELKLLDGLNAIFIAAPREISDSRLLQLIKKYLPKGNIVIGVANETYISGFENQPQFKTLKISMDDKIISKVNSSGSPHKITVLKYNQADVSKIYEKVKFKRAILINGSWLYSFHLRPEYEVLKKFSIPFKYVSPFCNENEAIKYANNFKAKLVVMDKSLSETEMISVANEAAKNSFDTSFQVGVALGIKHGDKYKLIDTAYNKVVPHITYAWHNGASREKFKSQPGDIGHYDTIHSEVMIILQAQKKRYITKGSTIFINLLPCPHCARILCEFDFDEIVYVRDHSGGYAVD